MFGRVRQLLSKTSERVEQRSSAPQLLNHTPPVVIAESEATVYAEETSTVAECAVNAVNNGKNLESVDESPFGLKVLVYQPPDQDGAVDIIAIHGLNGHWRKTWTEKTSFINWLSNASCLPKDIPNARVLSFGYNSKSYFSRSDADIQDFASELLAAIKSNRRSNLEKQRPIVFVCHSLGGLVFKQAIVTAHEQNRFYGQFLENVRGVLFFATPHRGSSLAFWDALGTRVVKAAALGQSTNTKISKQLQVNSATLKSISDSFTYRAWNFEIRSFYETELMPGLNCRVVERDSAILGWGNELHISSSSHHSNICKFMSPNDQRYRNAIDAIYDIIQPMEDTTLLPLSVQDVHLMSRLNSNYEQQLEQVDDPVPGTCTWVRSHDKWQRWLSHSGSSLLWITSNAGCGKSVLAKSLVKHFQSTKGTNTKAAIGYFFFMEGISGQDNAASAVSALLHQLCSMRHDLAKYASKRLDGIADSALNKLAVLWPILVESVCSNTHNDIVWVLDGIDECEAASFEILIKAVSNLFDTHSPLHKSLPKGRLKILLLSRPSNLIQNTLCLYADSNDNKNSSNKFRLSGENEIQAIAADIARFAHWRIKELSSASVLPERILQQLQERLVAGADFTFLWISLVIKMVEDAALNGISIADLDRILATTNLDDVYEKLLAAPAKRFPYKTRKVISILLASVRPLTLDELCVAIEIYGPDHHAERESPDKKGPLPKQWITDNVKAEEILHLTLQEVERHLHKPVDNYIRQLCGHFVRIRCSKVYLVHQTARTFLMTKSFELESEILEESRFIWEPINFSTATQSLLHICVNYLQIFARESEQSGETEIMDQYAVDKYLDNCRLESAQAFFPYAALNWIHHYRLVRKLLQQQYDWMLQSNTAQFRVWAKVHLSWTEEHSLADTDENRRYEHQHYLGTVNAAIVHQHYMTFCELQRWVSSRWFIASVSEEMHDEARKCREKLAQHEKYVILKKFFAQGSIQDLFAARRVIQTAPELQLSPPRIEEYIETIYRDWTREIKAFPGHDLIRFIPEQKKGSLAAQQQGILTARGVNEALLEALMHFDLLELGELGLDDDEYLKDHWQSRREASGFGDMRDEGEDVQKTNQHDFDVPYRVKHYIRQRARDLSDDQVAGGTPGATHPGLSNPGSRMSTPKEWRNI